MRKTIIIAMALSLTLSGCASNGQGGSKGGTNFGDVLLTGLGLAAAGAGIYYTNLRGGRLTSGIPKLTKV
jgi:hypothetical protein